MSDLRAAAQNVVLIAVFRDDFAILRLRLPLVASLIRRQDDATYLVRHARDEITMRLVDGFRQQPVGLAMCEREFRGSSQNLQDFDDFIGR